MQLLAEAHVLLQQAAPRRALRRLAPASCQGCLLHSVAQLLHLRLEGRAQPEEEVIHKHVLRERHCKGKGGQQEQRKPCMRAEAYHAKADAGTDSEKQFANLPAEAVSTLMCHQGTLLHAPPHAQRSPPCQSPVRHGGLQSDVQHHQADGGADEATEGHRNPQGLGHHRLHAGHVRPGEDVRRRQDQVGGEHASEADSRGESAQEQRGRLAAHWTEDLPQLLRGLCRVDHGLGQHGLA
mmetsp:Transcript_74621/g.235859  ORF Transcript_74621/g.235859 Transcript_74621/m.235859 type:complete len:238 (-) Transcript_74621:81-794(-)